MKRKSSRICGQEDEDGLHAVPEAVAQEEAQPVVGQEQGGVGAERG